ncbi:MAG TPA: carbohydrate kinase family protein, partial [Candidatus Limnocylindrales bacterium]|nr:carbohydrate kinase family protein [Candidatus Limnocylindrales bacterium]
MSWTEHGPTRWHPGRISVVGNPGLDTLVILVEDDPDLEADGHFVRNVDTVGHAAAFTARACARLGHHTRILGSTGPDVIGALVREVLAADGVNTSLLFDDPFGTARSVNFIRPDGRRTFFFDGGSHMTLRAPEASVEAALSGADLVFASLPNWARDVVGRAHARGLTVAVDLQDVRDPADPYRADFIGAADYL